MEFPAEIAAFVDYMTISRNRSPRTAKEYARDILRFARFLSSPLTEATTEQIESWRDELLTEGKNQPQSVLRKIAAVSAFFTWCKKKKMRLDNPCEDVEKPATAKRLPKVMNEDEVQLLLEVTIPHRRWNQFLETRDKAMMEVLYGSGLRRFEVTGLDLMDVDLKSRKVRVRHGKGDKERYSFLSEPAIKAITEYLIHREKYAHDGALFITVRGERLTPRSLWAVFRDHREAAKKLGLTKHVVPHTMRHSFATHIYRRSRDIRAVQKLLGHSSINTTEKYTHVEDDALYDIYRDSHPRAQVS